MKIILVLVCSIFLFSSCSVIQSINIKDKATIIKALAKSGTYLSLITIYNNDKIDKRLEVARILKQDIANNVIAVLSNDSLFISKETLNNLLNHIPEKMRIYLRSALNLLSIKRIDLSEKIGEFPTQLVKNLFIGIIDGCNMIIESEKNNVVDPNSPENLDI